MPRWRFLGEGTYNKAYRSEDGTKVLKIQKYNYEFAAYDAPERSVRLWNLLNGHIPPPAYIENTKHGLGWVCPFIEGVQATDKEMKDALIDIFNKTGRIVLDAMSHKNIIKTAVGQIVCVDMGMAVQMELREGAHFARARSNSVTSLNIWRNMHGKYHDYFRTWRNTYPNTVDTIKALMFIYSNRPDIFNVSFLRDDPARVTLLARAYDAQGVQDALADLEREVQEVPDEVDEALDGLEAAREINLNNIKESCELQLNRYIQSRGSISHEGQFEPSLATKIFRDTQLTAAKVARVRELIEQIKDVDSLDAIDDIIQRAQQDEGLTTSYFTSSGVAASLGKCMIIIETARELGHQDDLQPRDGLRLR